MPNEPTDTTPAALARDCVVVVCRSDQVEQAKSLWTQSHFEEAPGLPTDVFALARVFDTIGNSQPKVDEYDQRVLLFVSKAAQED